MPAPRNKAAQPKLRFSGCFMDFDWVFACVIRMQFQINEPKIIIARAMQRNCRGARALKTTSAPRSSGRAVRQALPPAGPGLGGDDSTDNACWPVTGPAGLPACVDRFGQGRALSSLAAWLWPLICSWASFRFGHGMMPAAPRRSRQAP